MKNIKFILSLLIASAMFWSCADEQLDAESIFKDEVIGVSNEFDTWLYNNYTVPYNIQFKYRFDEKETDFRYNHAPASYEKSVALSKLIKHLWVDAYDELLGKSFLQKHGPRVFQLIGSRAFTGAGSVVLGTAEGGLKVTLYNVNGIDVDNPDLDYLNYWYFNTMHHEFAHILHQIKSYSTDYNLITPTDYQSGSWVNVPDTMALRMGFISPYGSSEPQEDFVEMISRYVTSSDQQWNNLLENPTHRNRVAAAAGKQKILEKLAFVKDYLISNWDINLDELRKIVQRRSAEIDTLDLESLK